MVDTASFFLDVVNCLAAPIGRSFMYLYNYKKNTDNLQDEVKNLKSTSEAVQAKVVAAEKNVEEIKQSVKAWQKDVEKTITEAEKLIEEKENNPRCFKGLCPNWITRYKLSKKAFKLKENDISQILDMDFNEVSYPTIPQKIWLRSNEDYLAFESRTSTEKNLWDALNDENIYSIGVYGMGGIGKTSLVQEVGRKAEKYKLFDEIVFVEVTEIPNLKKIQTRIGDMLGLKFRKDESQIEIANKLYSRMQGKKILLILDNIWEELDFKAIGILSKADHGRSKILMTTRNLNVLEMMDSTNNFTMGVLKEEEAWCLFKKMAGNVIQTPELNSLPNEVCKECGGLPIVICTIARALRNKRQIFQWKDALRALRMPSPTKFTRLLEKEYSKIKLSYDYLEDDELKKTFIISSLMENNTSISDLFKNIVSLGILEGVNLTIEQARDRLDSVVKELKDSCLLLDGRTKGRFSMHDLVRVVALTCAYTDYHVFTEKNDIESEWKDKNKLRKCTVISLVGNNIITQLWPEGLNCPKLEFFYMSRGSLFEIPEDFFTMISKLKVLNLRSIRPLSLPSSLDLLTNLQTLCLDYSKIKDVAIIGKLRKLHVLSLQGSDIKELTTEIGQLTQLRLLDLSNCWRLEVIAPNVISKLSYLEELHIKGCPIHWKVEVLEELNGLSQLANLELDIKDNKILPKGFFSKDLRRYKISIGDWPFQNVRINQDESLRMLEFKFNSTISLEEIRGIKNVENLFLAVDVDNSLDELQSNITPLFNEKLIFSNLMTLELKDYCSRKIWDNQLPTFMSSSYQNLTHLTLQRCRNIEYAFPFSIAKSLMQLQYLEIMDGKILKEIVAKEEGANIVVNFVFPNVTLLKLENLPELTVFYPERYTSEWPKLKELVVINCDKLTSKHMSFQENSEEGELNISDSNAIFLDDKINSHLEKMELQNKNRGIEWQSQSKVLKIRHDVSANIPFELLQTFENLNELQLSFCDQYKEVKCLFDPPNLEVLDVSFCYRLMSVVSSSVFFHNLKVLRVNSCNGLMMNVITPSMARSLVQLSEMRIKYCQMVIEIVENEGDATTTTEIAFNNLKKLSIIGLDNLTCFCSGNYFFKFPCLEDLIIRNCPNMKTFSKGILSTPKLQKVVYLGEEIMDLESGRELNTIIQEAHKEKVYFNLKKLTLALSGRDILSIWQGEFQENFGKVKTLQFTMDNSTDIPIRILQKFNSLEKLILKMSSYEKIFSSGEDEELAGTLTKLKVLELQGLFNLKCIWKQDSRLNSILQNLDRLKVQYCHNLMTLLPSSKSFENLTTLTVTYCNGMQNLMSSSTAKSLERLEHLLIERCEMMTEVLANEGDLEKGEIVFEKLKELCFYSLENLTCFCSGDYILEFPVLESLDVNECSKMKTFSREGLSMPRLQELNGRDCSKSDLNTITQQLQNDCSELWERFPGF